MEACNKDRSFIGVFLTSFGVSVFITICTESEIPCDPVDEEILS
jgi:hypothetical protein